MVTLRPYQLEAVEAIRSAWAGGDRATLLVMATGTGKTTVFGEVARRCIDNDRNVLVLAHRDELIRQAASRMESMCGVRAGIEKAEARYLYNTPLCVASVQTLQGDRLLGVDPRWFDVVIVDEAHHAVSDSYRNIIDHVGGKLLGVTATADRADRRGLAEVFDSIAYEYPLARAVKDGYLCPIRAKCLPLAMDLTGVKVSHGDYQANDLGDALEPYLAQVAQVMAGECAGRKTVVFLPLVSTAEKMADALRAVGMRAVCVSGYDAMEERRAKIAAFESGEADVLCNSMLLTEGWDCPEVDCIVVLRPTRSRPLYTQMVGRGTRTAPGKDGLLLLDFLWMTERHDLCRPASLLGIDPDVAARMQQRAEQGAEADIMAEAEAAESEVAAEREAAVARQLAELKHRKKKLVDPLQFAMSTLDMDLIGYKPTFKWEFDAATERQCKLLEGAGIDPTGLTKGQATKLVASVQMRRNAGLATAKQIRFLEGKGFQHVARWSKDDASRMISRIEKNGWITPRGIDPATYNPTEGGEAA